MTRAALRSSALLLAWLAGCAAVDKTEPLVVGKDFKLATPCVVPNKVPQILQTYPAEFSDEVWARRQTWESQMRFRVDDEGMPSEVRAVVRGVEGDADVLEQAAIGALAGYRFCAHVGLPTNAEWTARMLFTWSPVADKAGGGEMVVQLFLPSYTRDDVSSRRAGTNRVQGMFGQDGRPMTVRLSASSGDPVLDRKSLNAIAGYQLVFKPGMVLTHPLAFEQPFTYQIR